MRGDISSASKYLSDIQKRHIPFATARALTMTAEDARVKLTKEISTVFDRPVPFTQKSIFKKGATKAKLSAMVWVKDDGATKGTPAVKYLAPQIYGGKRNLKRFEKALQAIGILPPGMIAVPGKAAEKDAYGNMSRGQIVRLLSYFQAFPQSGYRANITDRGKARLAKGNQAKGVRGVDYFALGRQTGKLSPGIYKRIKYTGGDALKVSHLQKGGAKPVVLFVREATYRKRWRFFETSKRVSEARFPARFEQALANALATAR